VTEGAANPQRSFVIDDDTYITIPYEKAINPHTKTNWEGVGVIPDHMLSKDVDALEYAQKIIEAR